MVVLLLTARYAASKRGVHIIVATPGRLLDPEWNENRFLATIH